MSSNSSQMVSCWVARMGVIVLLAAGLLVPSVPARAAAMTVSPELVFVSSDGLCSLHEAIANAEADSQVHADCPAGEGADVITLPAGTYELYSQRAGSSANSAFVITSDITLVGAGSNLRSGATVLDAGGAFRHFFVKEDATLHLQDLRLERGARCCGSFDYGGAVHNRGDTTTLRVAFVGNRATAGGAVYNCGFNGTCGSFVADETTFSQNTSEHGGAILNQGDMTVVGSMLWGNEAQEGSAIVSMAVNPPPSIKVIDSVVTHNTSTDAGQPAIFNGLGEIEVVGSTVHANGGGGVANHMGSAVIRDSTISNNTGGLAGGILNVATTDYLSASLDVVGSTITGNSGSQAGGISNRLVDGCDAGANRGCDSVTASADVRNSTLTGNTATGSAGAGAIHSTATSTVGAAVLSLSNATIVGNQAPGAQAQVRAAETHVRNTIIASPPSANANCDQLGVWATLANLSDDVSCPGAFSLVFNANLQPLADNGGPTRTHLPHPASAAVNAGDQGGCNAAGLTTDQRGIGFPRTIGSSCDIGAVEAHAPELTGVLVVDVAQLRFDGPGRHDGLRTSLGAKLDAASAAMARGDDEAAAGQLNAFTKQVNAHRGGPIMEADADRLVTGAHVVVDLLAGEGDEPDDDRHR